jgi:hypothetical protein
VTAAAPMHSTSGSQLAVLNSASTWRPRTSVLCRGSIVADIGFAFVVLLFAFEVVVGFVTRG